MEVLGKEMEAVETVELDSGAPPAKIRKVLAMDLKAHYQEDRLAGQSSRYFCAFCTAEKQNQHLTAASVAKMRPGRAKTEAEGKLGKPRTVEYALQAATRLEKFVETAAIYRAAQDHCSGEKKQQKSC